MRSRASDPGLVLGTSFTCTRSSRLTQDLGDRRPLALNRAGVLIDQVRKPSGVLLRALGARWARRSGIWSLAGVDGVPGDFSKLDVEVLGGLAQNVEGLVSASFLGSLAAEVVVGAMAVVAVLPSCGVLLKTLSSITTPSQADRTDSPTRA